MMFSLQEGGPAGPLRDRRCAATRRVRHVRGIDEKSIGGATRRFGAAALACGIGHFAAARCAAPLVTRAI
ncbi:hypothetical protein WI78_12615 [Burkholderia ubonensis]|nr:hypothetical protein WI78_12615 [Burkholderia ubonensis]